MTSSLDIVVEGDDSSKVKICKDVVVVDKCATAAVADDIVFQEWL